MSSEHPYARTDLSGTDFSSVDLSGESLVHSDISGCKFGVCRGTKFICSRGSGSDFHGADITGASFEKAEEAVLTSLVGAVWDTTEVKHVSGWLVTEGYWSFVTNCFVQCGCMVRTISEWQRICASTETITELLQEQPDLDLAEAYSWWQKNSSLLIECSNDFAARG